MRIGDRDIGPQAGVYIIAELGVNHDGSVERALELADAAADAGADAIKLQLFKTDLLMSKAAKLAAYQKAAGETDPIAMLRRLELPIDAMARVVDRAHSRGLHAIVTVFSLDLVPEAETLPWDAYKTASPDIIHEPLLDALVATGKPLIVSTGASELEEVRRAIAWLTRRRDQLAILQCVSSYPTPFFEGGWGGFRDLRDLFDGPIGYSDHVADDPEWGEGARLASADQAVRCLACVLEKHLTYDRTATGPDHSSSLSPGDFREYVAIARRADGLWRHGPPTVLKGHTDIDPRIEERLRRHSGKHVLDIEREVRTVSRQSLVTRRALPADHRVRPEDLTIKRPGTGIEPWRLEETIGRLTARPLEADMPITPDDLV